MPDAVGELLGITHLLLLSKCLLLCSHRTLAMYSLYTYHVLNMCSPCAYCELTVYTCVSSRTYYVPDAVGAWLGLGLGT